MLDLFIGDPVYDGQKNVIRRDFGVKNIVAIMVVGFAGYSLMGETKPISGKRKMKGGVGGEEVIIGIIAFIVIGGANALIIDYVYNALAAAGKENSY